MRWFFKIEQISAGKISKTQQLAPKHTQMAKQHCQCRQVFFLTFPLSQPVWPQVTPPLHNLTRIFKGTFHTHCPFHEELPFLPPQSPHLPPVTSNVVIDIDCWEAAGSVTSLCWEFRERTQASGELMLGPDNPPFLPEKIVFPSLLSFSPIWFSILVGIFHHSPSFHDCRWCLIKKKKGKTEKLA